MPARSGVSTRGQGPFLRSMFAEPQQIVASMNTVSFDPQDGDRVAERLLHELTPQWPTVIIASVPEYVSAATSTWVWFVDLSGTDLPSTLRGSQVLRIFRPDQAEQTSMEVALGATLASLGYPVANVLWTGTLAGTHPAVLQRRLPGAMAMDSLKTTRVKSTIDGMARLQARLHRLPTTSFDLCKLSAEDYLADDLARRRAHVSAVDPTGTWEWLCRTAPTMSTSDNVVCHGDFHPLNVLIDATGSMGVVDWTDACIADRHHDVGRTTSLYSLAYVLADSPVERMALRAMRKRIVAWHLKSYEAEARLAVDPRRLAWWQAVHAFRGWLQLCEVDERAVEDRRSSTVDAIPPSVRQALLAQCVSLRRVSRVEA